MGSVGTATAEALCAAMPLAPQAQLQSYTYKAGEALARCSQRSYGFRRALRAGRARMGATRFGGERPAVRWTGSDWPVLRFSLEYSHNIS
jgi:hypothetical protein